MTRVLIYGGTFNPVHIGHLRLAIEAREILGGIQVNFVPSGRHPHKSARGILPFGLRAALVASAISGLAGMSLNTIEERMPGPSYTYDMLAAYPGSLASRCFLLGSQDFALLPSWSRGLELPEVASLAVAPRGGFDRHDFRRLVGQYWPAAVIDTESINNLRYLRQPGDCYRHPSGARIYFLPIPQLEISATEIRAAWLAGRNIAFLLPPAVLAAIEMERALVGACWQEKD